MSERDEAGERLRLALELHEAGVALMRCNLRRRHPAATEAELDELLGRWLQDRAGAEHLGSAAPPDLRR